MGKYRKSSFSGGIKMKFKNIFVDDWGNWHMLWVILLIIIMLFIILAFVYIPSIMLSNNVEKHTCENIGQSEITSIKNDGLGIRTCYILDDSNKWIPFSKYNVNKIQ